MNTATSNANYTFLGTTQSLCPQCFQVVPAKIIARGQRVYFRKRCPEHGVREDFIWSDRTTYDRYDFALPPKRPKQVFVEAERGCPLDCGICTEHEQHTCIGVLEVTDGCNLSCPMCYADSRPGKKHRTLSEIQSAIDALVKAEGRADVLQLSGGEPTIHPEFYAILDYALSQPIDYIMVNTNGIRLASDDRLMEKLSRHKNRVEIYLQFDGLSDDVFVALRGEKLLDTKLKALDRIAEYGLHATLVATLQAGVNEKELGKLIDLCRKRTYISGLSLQPATYSGRYYLPEELESRITAPDCVQLLCEQSDNAWTADDFFPLPCAHPNCHILGLAYRYDGQLLPLTRFIDAQANLDLLANGLSFTRDEGMRLVQKYLARTECCGPGGCVVDESPSFVPMPPRIGQGLPVLSTNSSDVIQIANNFFDAALSKNLGGDQLFRITITSFLDVYNFDVRRVMKCCTHHVLPSGHLIPFCAYNVLYRPGHVPLPTLRSPEAIQG